MFYLDSGLGKVDLEGHLLPHEDVWVARFGKQSLKDIQLCACEGGALPTLFTRGVYNGEKKTIDVIFIIIIIIIINMIALFFMFVFKIVCTKIVKICIYGGSNI